MKYKVCPLCNSALDFGEKCECRLAKEEKTNEVSENNKPSEVSEGGGVDSRSDVLVMLRLLQDELRRT